MTRLTLVLSNDTDRALRMFLAQNGGKKGDLSHFVEEAVRKRLFDLTVDRIKKRNSAYPPAEIMDAIEEALNAARS